MEGNKVGWANRLLVFPLALLFFSGTFAQEDAPSICQINEVGSVLPDSPSGCIASIINESGDRYDGQFVDGKFHGIGKFTAKSGYTYIGEWHSGVPNGAGAMFFDAAGGPKVGQWDRGALAERRPIDRDQYEAKVIQFARAFESSQRRSGQAQIKDAAAPPSPPQSLIRDQSNSPRLALVIGNATYKTSPLANPTNDAKAVSGALKNAGFEVMHFENLNNREMRNAVRDFSSKLSKKHVALFYFSGHGVQVDGRNFLIPVDSDIQYEDEVASLALDADFVLSKVRSAGNRMNIVVLDACRDSPLGRRTRTRTRGLSTMEAASGTLIAFSTAPGEVALDGQGTLSPYTKHFVASIGKRGYLLEQVFKEVRGNVMQETDGRQVPWENSSILGDFYFTPPK